MMKKFCSLLLSLVLLFSMVTTAFAASDPDLKVAENDTLNELENAVGHSEGGYSYTPPSSGNFLIESATGAISIVNEIATIEFDSHIVAIPSFDYYKIVDQSGNLRFYQADVSKDPYQTSNFAYIGLYIEDGPAYSIHVHYAVDVENKLYNVKIPLTQEQFLFFTEDSAQICLGADAVSQRLKASARVYTHGTFEDQSDYDLSSGDNVQYMMDGSASTYALNTVAANSYDSYTDSDGIIHSYVSDYFGEYYLDDDWTITDDPIVNIIPKNLCFILGEHIYVGKEYGFFIRVVVDTMDTDDYAADILVFDISHSTPSFTTTETGSSRVTPLFQFTYRAAYADSLVSDVDPSLSRVVFPHAHYDYAEYHLKDVGFKFTLDNPTALNPSDSGYVPSNDNGAFMIQTRVNASGVGLKKKNGSFAADTAMFALGFVPYLGTGLSVFSYAHDVYNGFGNQHYFYARPYEFNNELNISTLKTNSTDQIAEYGNLIKSQSVKLTADPSEPRLIHVGGYVEAKYVIARKSGSNYNKIRVITSISVSVVEDDTELILGLFESGELIEYGRCTGTYETGTYKRLNNVSLSGRTTVTIPANSQTNVIRIVPQTSGSYQFTTSSSSGDPHFRITNATTGAAAVSATDDIDGANNRNATLTITLTAGNIYYLEAFRYGTPYNYNLIMQPTS